MTLTNKCPLLIFDFYDETERPQRLCFTNPEQIFVADCIPQVRPVLLAAERAASEGFYVAGYVGYDAAPAFDPALVVHDGAGMPLAWFAVFGEPTDASSEAGLLRKSLSKEFSVSEWQPSVTQVAYCENVASIREAIACGDTYQVNYSMRLRAKFEGDSFVYYERLRSAQCGRYCAYLDISKYQILSASPELFFRRTGNRIVTRPMKGTERRGRWTEEDDALKARLASSQKDQAENVMIVDLIRNDLGRIASTGSINISRLFEIERYSTLFQMTSTVEAVLRPETTLDQIFNALFPCGSVTGAPKVSTMKLIAELEDSPREVYCGSIGLIKPGGDCVFNVAIRTVIVDLESGAAEYGVGGGITWNSTAEGEYEEALTKARVLTEEMPEFALLETLKLENCQYVLLDRHLRRFANSARYFDIPVSLVAVQDALREHAMAYCNEKRRVRLLVSQKGEVSIESSPCEQWPHDNPVVKLADTPISRSSVMLFHKTTDRKVFEEHRLRDSKCFDTLLWNEKGELTEFTNGNLVAEIDGRLWTPPLDCGLLPGTLRAELLARGEIAERVIERSDLHRAKRIWFINSVRGWLEVHLAS